jgi:hypothetical protein
LNPYGKVFQWDSYARMFLGGSYGRGRIHVISKCTEALVVGRRNRTSVSSQTDGVLPPLTPLDRNMKTKPIE